MQEHRTAEEVKAAAKQSRKQKLEAAFLESWQRLYRKLPPVTREHRFHSVRMWRFDFAWPEFKVAAEIDGGSFVGGGHNRGSQQAKDYEKQRAAVRLGWRVLRFNTLDMKDPDACATEVAELLTDAKEVA